MPAIHAVDKDIGLYVIRFSGQVTTPEVSDAISGLSELTCRAEPACSLLIFEHTTDLSEIDPMEIKSFRDEAALRYRQMNVRRRAGAAVLAGSQDARIMMPFWNALCMTETNPSLHYEFFNETETAIDWLGLPKDAGLAVARRTERPTQQAALAFAAADLKVRAKKSAILPEQTIRMTLIQLAASNFGPPMRPPKMFTGYRAWKRANLDQQSRALAD